MRQHELTELALILLAAGYSRRFGQNKLLYPVNGKPMYSYGLDTLKKAAGLLKVNCQVQVVTQYEQILEACISQGFPVYMNPAPDLGIASSMQVGLQHNLHKDACLFMVADQPGLTAGSVKELVDGFLLSEKGMGVCCFQEKMGNPCIFGSRYYPQLLKLSGDRGGKVLIRQYPEDVFYYQIRDPQELLDIDYSPELSGRS